MNPVFALHVERKIVSTVLIFFHLATSFDVVIFITDFDLLLDNVHLLSTVYFLSWLIDYLLNNVLLRSHHCRCRGAKFWPMFGAHGLLNCEGSLLCHTCCDMGPQFFWSHRKDRPIQSRLTGGCGGSILTGILTGLSYNDSKIFFTISFYFCDLFFFDATINKIPQVWLGVYSISFDISNLGASWRGFTINEWRRDLPFSLFKRRFQMSEELSRGTWNDIKRNKFVILNQTETVK
jgi:hypothetical protein